MAHSSLGEKSLRIMSEFFTNHGNYYYYLIIKRSARPCGDARGQIDALHVGTPPARRAAPALRRRPHQHQRNRRHVTDQHQGRKVDQHERNHAAINRAQRLVEDRLRGEQVETEWRGVHADRQIDRHDDAEVDGVDARRLDDREKQGREDHDGGRRFEETADQQKAEIDQQQDLPQRQLQRIHGADDVLRNAARGQQPGIDAGGRHDDENLGDQEYGRERDAPQVAPADVAVDEHGHHQRVDSRDPGGFGRCEDAAIDAAEDHERRTERPAGLLGGGPDFRPRRPLAGRDLAGAGVEDDVDRVDEPDQQARQDAGREQRDRGLLRRHAVEDHRDGGRNHHRDGARRSDQADRETVPIAAALESRIDQSSDRRNSADGGVRHRTEQL